MQQDVGERAQLGETEAFITATLLSARMNTRACFETSYVCGWDVFQERESDTSEMLFLLLSSLSG